MRIFAGAAAIAFLATGHPAAAAENLECMEGGYSEEELEAIEQFKKVYSSDPLFQRADGYSREAFESLIKILENKGEECAEQNGWNDNARTIAIGYRLGTLQHAIGMQHDPEMQMHFDRYQADTPADIQAKVSKLALIHTANIMPGGEDLERKLTDEEIEMIQSTFRKIGLPEERGPDFISMLFSHDTLMEIRKRFEQE